jgi:quercetin dioxygenase-like cupin family protein
MRRKVKTLKKLSLDGIGREQLVHAKDESSGRSSSTVFGGHEQVLRHTVIALREGSSLTEHNSPGEATIIVLSGHVLLSAGSTSWEGHKGDLLVIPPERHSLEALKDTVVVLTTAMVV